MRWAGGGPVERHGPGIDEMTGRAKRVKVTYDVALRAFVASGIFPNLLLVFQKKLAPLDIPACSSSSYTNSIWYLIVCLLTEYLL